MPRTAAQMPDVSQLDGRALSRLKDAITRFAKLANIHGCLQTWDAAPLGYYVKMLPTPIAEDRQSRLEHRAWWLLALVSGQTHPSVRARLPEASRWRRVAAKEGHNDEDSPGLLDSGMPAVMQLDAEFFDWMLDAQDEVATTFWEIVNLARKLRSATPQQVETSDKPNAITGSR